MMKSKDNLDFPVWGLIPKRETGIDSFLNIYPKYDGRGTVIAILDSGVDPGARGLEKTSNGEVKIIHCYDCTGCGDVPLSEPIEPTDGCVTGITGRKLKIPTKWINPTNSYRLGVKHAFDLYPESIKKKIQDKYQEEWSKQHALVLDEINRNLINFEESNLSEGLRLLKEDAEAKLEVLNSLQEKYYDPGPVYDCLLFHDGTKWLACVDITENGDLSSCKVLGEYSITHEYAALTDQGYLNYSINVHNDGCLLELVVISSIHGTHIASIAAGYIEDEPEKSGIAPGAQIVSFTVCDRRLGSSITGTALIRAIIKIIELSKEKPVIIHSSFGELAHWSNTSRFGELVIEIIDKYRCVWIAAAGDYGPALTTVTTPPDISQDVIIGVGAYVSPNMMAAVHSLRQKLSEMIYTWSSRNPTTSGSFGVNICAPGGAITSVYSFKTSNAEVKNSTSVASTYVAGATALLLSGSLAEQKFWSPHSVKRALENGASHLEDIESFAQGHGLLNIEKSYSILTDSNFTLDVYARFDISCGPDKTNRGIFIWCTSACTSQEWSVSIEPKFIEGAASIEKLEFNLKLILECDAFYISFPKYLNISNMARTINVKINSESLKSGAYTTNIEAYNVDNMTRGPVFRIPITIIKAQEVDTATYTFSSKKKVFKPNTLKRYFFMVPETATWATFHIRCQEVDRIGQFVLQCIQIVPQTSCKALETKYNMSISSNTENLKSFRVQGGLVLEVVIAKNWDSLGDMTIQYSISFFGIKPNEPFVTMHAVDGIYHLEVTALRGEEVVPVVTLNNSERYLSPSESKIRPLTNRDIIPPGKQIYELILTYNFYLIRATEVSPKNPVLSDFLYESEFESQMWMLFDNNKQCLGCGDAYSSKYNIKLEKGDYTIRSQIRHDKKEYLEKLVGLSFLLIQKLPNPVVMDVFPTYTDALIGGKKATNLQAAYPPYVTPLYIASLSADKYKIKENNIADALIGNITFAKDELGKVDTYPIKYILSPREVTKKSSESKENQKAKFEDYKEALRDFKTSWMQKMEKEDAEKLYEEVQEEFPADLQSHISMLRFLHPVEPKMQLPVFKEEIINNYNIDELQNKILPMCDKILESLDQEEILYYFAVKKSSKEDNAKKQNTMTTNKAALIDALCQKGITFCRLYQYAQYKDDLSLKESVTKETISIVWENLCKFVDFKEKNPANVLLFAMWHAVIEKQYGCLLKFLLKYQEEKKCREVEEKCIEVYEFLGWHHLAKYLRRTLPSKYPSDYKPF